MTISSAQSGSSSATMPFITYTKVKSGKNNRSATPSRSTTTIESILEQSRIENETDLPQKVEFRSYSPIPRSRLLEDDDPDQTYVERVMEIGNDMDLALGFMEDLQNHFKKGTDLKLFDNMTGLTEKVIDDHIECMEKASKDFFKANFETDAMI